ncbi:ribonuclease III [Variovorax sp. PCZ-1]|uniref:ribonuclease III n=1 Tax=Variovorax sp. PCZ-1 TaxID=2835533 RepID=UPI001BCC9C55|nr:ribonuclease III [Variovorax sp. PCZ-1]MBS7807194.1 ribonuclease III [Variovorax sp. PCZ-1]
MSEALAPLQKRLQHTFAKPALLTQALTHRSYSADHNERLEFLGDSVLNLAVSGMLYQALGSLHEGELSRVRANLVKQGTLHAIAQELHLGNLIRLGEGELRSGGAKRPSILADALEAVIGAVYLDAGFDKAAALVHRLFDKVEINPDMPAAAKDAKTELQEWLQGRKMKLPAYNVMSITGAAHRQTFEVQCKIEEMQHEARGFGNSRRAAEQEAAAAMLKLLALAV